MAEPKRIIIGLDLLDLQSPLGLPIVRDVQEVFHKIINAN